MPTGIKERLRRGEVTIGSWIQFTDPSVAELIGDGGFDWVALDLEHSGMSPEVMRDMVRGLELRRTVPFARVAQIARKDIQHALDAGCRGIILPMVESAEQLTEALAWTKYPPEGSRGLGYSRSNLFGRTIVADFKAQTSANDLDSGKSTSRFASP